MSASPALSVVGTTDPRSMGDVIWSRFVAETGTDVELRYRQDVSTGRVLAAIRDAPPGDRPDVVIVSNPAALAAAGLARGADVVDRGGLPDGWLDAEGRWWPVYVQPVVAIHNAHRGAPPRTWLDLADPRWTDRACVEQPWRMLTTGPALAELSAVMGDRAWDEFVDALVARRPLLVGDNERTVLEVATGSRWVGLSNWNVALRVRPGSPVRHVFLGPVPCIPGFGVLVEGGRQPEIALRFLRWLVGDGGQRAYAETGRIPARSEVDAVTRLDRVLPRGVSPALGVSDWVTEPDRWAARLRDRFGALATGDEPVRQAKRST